MQEPSDTYRNLQHISMSQYGMMYNDSFCTYYI